MMNRIASLMATFALLATTTYVASAQEEVHQKKKVKIEIGAGVNVFGPQNRVASLMDRYGYNVTTKSWLTGEDIKSPSTEEMGLTAQLSVSYPISLRGRVGALLNTTRFLEVTGYSATGGYLFIGFSNSYSFAPLYIYEINKALELQAGPSLSIITVKKTSYGGSSGEKYTRLSAGILAGADLLLWNRRVTFGKIGAYYLLNFGNKVGPFTSEGYNTSSSIPASRVTFGYLNLYAAFGVNLF